MLNKTKNILKDINASQFASQMCDAVKSACESFWEQDIKIILQGVNNFRELRKEKLISRLDFFTSQIKVENHKPVVIRLSQQFIGEILDSTLDSNYPNFNFKQLTSLEIRILNSFCEFAYKKIKENLLNVPLSENSEKYINLVFLIASKNDICSKIMVSIPQDRIDFSPLKKEVAFSDEDFLSSNTSIRLKAGSSKITFDELQNLAPDDIVVLEDSNLNKMKLVSGKTEKEFNIKINSSLIFDIDQDEQEEYDDEEDVSTHNEVIMGKNLWDDIQIEINAEFEKVKMTIGELKYITEGQIVDLGSVFDNEISLFVEERKVATGELIIINDRYAVRLNKILNSNPQPEPIKANVEVQEPKTPQSKPAQPKPAVAKPAKPAQPQPKPAQPKPQPAPQAPVEDEEFDYSDFEK